MEVKVSNSYSRLFIVLGAILSVLIIGFLAYRYIAPFGAIVNYQFTSNKNTNLSKLKGVEDSEEINKNSTSSISIPQQVIRKNIITFNLGLVSNKIKGIWVKMAFKGNPKEIKLGVRGDLNQKYLYQPLYHILLNDQGIEQVSDNLIFWQKETNYRSFDEFLSKMPADKLIATYYFDPGVLFLMQKNLKDSSKLGFTSTIKLRGTHTLNVLVDKTPFTFSVTKQDSNFYQGEDTMTIELYKGDRKIAETEIKDDGVTDKSQLTMLAQKETISIPDLEKGIYKVIIKDNSVGGDIYITKIETNQSKVVFLNNIFIVDKKPIKILTTIKVLSISTYHEDALQTVKLDNKANLAITAVKKPFVFDFDKLEASKSASLSTIETIHTLDIPKNDLILSGKGYFALTKESLFNPNPLQTVEATTLKSLDSVDYLVGHYNKVEKPDKNGFFTTSIFIDPKDITIDKNNKLYFSLESPSLDSYDGEIVLNNLEVTVEKPKWAAD